MKQKLHILFLCGWYPSRILPTNGDFIQRHAEAVATEHSVSVLHIISDENVSKTEYTIFEKNGIKTHIAYVKKSSNVFAKLQTFYIAYKNLIAKIGDFDVVHLNTLYPFGAFALHLKWLKKKPFIISEHHTIYLPLEVNKLGKIETFISKYIVKNASFTCPVSIDLQENMLKIGLKGTYKVVPNVINTSIFKPQEKESEDFKILHVSNMEDWQKNITGILNTVSTLKNTIHNLKITFIGENSSAYRVKAEKLNIKGIEFIDHIPQKELINHYQNSDVLVLFSNTETQSCVALESLACGTPVISSNLNCIAEYLNDGFGKLVPVKDEKRLKEVILELYNKKYKFDSKENMHTFIKNNYSPKKICSEFSNLYFKTLYK